MVSGMYELIVLTLLSRQPMHGYLIASVINDIIGPFARISNGRLYPLLAKLEADGMIVPQPASEAPAAGDRRQRAYVITETGRERLHNLMMDTTSNPGDYARFFWLKVPYLDGLTLHERLYLADHFINYCQTHIFHLTGEAEALRRDAGHRAYMSHDQMEATVSVIQHLINEWQLSADDARAIRARIEVEAEQATPATGSPAASENGS
jgi:DNA-binding PadR family transcriptional regulator